ncbi:MAG: triose-phosphate isomerase [Candidatus Micrarchaeota archaeon]
MKPTPIIGGNWKMNKTIAEAVALAGELESLVAPANCDVIVFPPATALKAVSEKLSSSHIEVGAQMINVNDSGAFTGQISIHMALDTGCRWALIGHSETRTIGEYSNREEYVKAHKAAVQEGRLPIETDSTVNMKAKAALAKGLKVIVCVGETDVERASGRTNAVIERQIQEGVRDISGEKFTSVVVAYEPRWAIGKGKQPATPEQAQEVHGLIRRLLCEIYGEGIGREVRIQYGGNANPENIASFMKQPDINGALVGGASLNAVTFSEIIMKALSSHD